MDVVRTVVAIGWAVVRGTGEAACMWIERACGSRPSVPDDVFYDGGGT